jgi:hypothetical protein
MAATRGGTAKPRGKRMAQEPDDSSKRPESGNGLTNLQWALVFVAVTLGMVVLKTVLRQYGIEW